ncbi:MAG: SMC family ATPase, partial [Abditibacteriota bacterium]|nr:SMC family ATPase [Abditibacteriota bacterium]
MRPIKVEFQAFGPYEGHETVDFDDLAKEGLFLVCGNTGAGKTMILDAMTFALYGRSSGAGRDELEKMRCTRADQKTATFVKFEFEAGGKRYLFERGYKFGTKKLSPYRKALIKNENGGWDPLFDNPVDTKMNAKSAEIIGLSFDQFRQIMVLPQGQFEKFLTSGPDNKEQILASILGEEKWQRIADIMFRDAEAARNALKQKQQSIKNSLEEEGCGTLSELSEKLEGLEKEKAERDEEYRKAGYDQTIREQNDLLSLAGRFGDLHNAEGRIEELDGRKAERDGNEARLKGAERAEKVRQLIDKEKDAANDLSERERQQKTAGKALEEAEEAFRAASEKLRLHREKEKENEKRKADKAVFEGKREAYERLAEAEEERAGLEEAFNTAEKDEKEAEKARGAYSVVINGLREEHKALIARHGELLDAYIAGITGELAEGLKEGEPCPVCGSTRHPKKAKPAENRASKETVEEAKRQADGKNDELEKQLKEQEKADKTLKEKSAAREKAEKALAGYAAGLSERKKALVPGIETAEALEKEIKKLEKAIKKYDGDATALENAEKAAKDSRTKAETRASSAEKETENARIARDNAAGALEKGLGENGFGSREEAEALLLSGEERKELLDAVHEYDAGVKAARENIERLQKELDGKTEPDKDKCETAIKEAEKAQKEYNTQAGTLSGEIKRLGEKYGRLTNEDGGLEESLQKAEEDCLFAKSLRGDSGTGLQRYVLGIMFSSVVRAANHMLEKV